MVEEGKFRSDLYYRLNVINLEVPPLRQRREDIIRLAEHFLDQQAEFYDEPYKQLSEQTKKMLINYNWPGNVRELSNAMERAYVLASKNVIQPSNLPFEVFDSGSSEYPKNELPTLDEVKRKVITQTLEHTSGRKMAAARILGIDRRKLNRLINRLDIAIHSLYLLEQ
jgi:DNA-binding NtrC family response regulator